MGSGSFDQDNASIMSRKSSAEEPKIPFHPVHLLNGARHPAAARARAFPAPARRAIRDARLGSPAQRLRYHVGVRQNQSRSIGRAGAVSRRANPANSSSVNPARRPAAVSSVPSAARPSGKTVSARRARTSASVLRPRRAARTRRARCTSSGKRVEVMPHEEPARLRLHSANPEYEPYTCLAEEAHIVGKVVWTVRKC